eukprot:5257067-Amphidinium_carterae.1
MGQVGGYLPMQTWQRCAPTVDKCATLVNPGQRWLCKRVLYNQHSTLGWEHRSCNGLLPPIHMSPQRARDTCSTKEKRKDHHNNKTRTDNECTM